MRRPISHAVDQKATQASEAWLRSNTGAARVAPCRSRVISTGMCSSDRPGVLAVPPRFRAGQKGRSDSIHAMAFEDSVLPIMRAGRAVLVQDDFELDTGVSLEPCRGHTPGHVVVNVASQGRRGVFIGDAVHHPMQLLFPDLSSRADGDMNASRVTRRALIEKHADTGNLVMPHHFATPSSGTIEKAGDSFHFTLIEGS